MVRQLLSSNTTSSNTTSLNSREYICTCVCEDVVDKLHTCRCRCVCVYLCTCRCMCTCDVYSYRLRLVIFVYPRALFCYDCLSLLLIVYPRLSLLRVCLCSDACHRLVAVNVVKRLLLPGSDVCRYHNVLPKVYVGLN